MSGNGKPKKKRQGFRRKRYYDPASNPQPRRTEPKKPGRNDMSTEAWLQAHSAEERERAELERLNARPLTRQQRRKLDRESRNRHPNGIGGAAAVNKPPLTTLEAVENFVEAMRELGGHSVSA